MKPIKEWLKELPEDIYERAMANNILDASESSLMDAVTNAFFWPESDEDYDFWQYVSLGEYDKARALLKPEPSPERESIRGFIEVTLVCGAKRLYNVSTIWQLSRRGEGSAIAFSSESDCFALIESYETVKELIKEATS